MSDEVAKGTGSLGGYRMYVLVMMKDQMKGMCVGLWSVVFYFLLYAHSLLFSLVSFDLFSFFSSFFLLLLPSPSSFFLLLFPPFANMYHNPGIVVRIGREKLSVLLQGGAVQQVLPSDLHYGNQNMQSKRAVTLDSRKQAVSETDAGAATKRISK